MCYPALIAAGASAAAQGGSGYLAGMATENRANMLAGELRYNAGVAQLAARDAVERADLSASRVKMAGSARMAHGVAATAESNLLPAGSPSRALADMSRLNEQDVQTILASGGREAWGNRAKASQFELEARQTLEAGKTNKAMALLTGGLAGAGTLLSYGQQAGWFQGGGSADATAGGGITITPDMAPKLVTSEEENGGGWMDAGAGGWSGN